MAFTFSKAERLCSRKLIDRLYAEGHRFVAFPFSVQWMVVDNPPSPCQVMIVAPKRRFKHAVDRNHVRRITRECYRKRKQHLYDLLDEHSTGIVLSLVYIHNEIMPFDQMEHKMDKLMAALEKEILATP